MTRKLTVKDAADLLRLSEKTLYNWASERKIPFLKVGGKLLFDEEALERFLENCRVEPSHGRRQ